jgi:hypothetical protein
MEFTDSIKDKLIWKVVAISIGLATTFWFLRAMDKDYTTNLSFPVHLKVDSGMVSVGPAPEEIVLNVSGQGWAILKRSLLLQKEELVIDATSISNPMSVEGRLLYPMVADKMKGLKVNFVKTERLNLNHDFLSQKKISFVLDPALKKIPFKNKPELSVSEVSLSGPRSYLLQIPKEIHVNIPVAKVEQEEDVVFSIYDFIPRGIQASDTLIEMNYRLIHMDHIELNVPVKYENFPWAIKRGMETEYALVSFDIDRSLKRKVSKKHFRIVADYDRRTGGKVKIRQTFKGHYTIQHFHVEPASISLP